MCMFIFCFLSHRALTKILNILWVIAPTAEKKEESLIRGTSEALLKGGAKKAGEEGVSYETEHAQEQLDDAKAQAQVDYVGTLWTNVMLIDSRACGRSTVVALVQREALMTRFRFVGL